MVSRIFKELTEVGLLIIAFILGVVLIPLGAIYSILIKPVYHLIKKDYNKANKGLGKYFANFLYQIWNVVKYVFWSAAYIIDLLGNVFTGELIEDIITPKEDTKLGAGSLTISAALGELEEDYLSDSTILNGRGKWLIKVLDKLDKNHCSKAIRLHRFKQHLKND